MMYRPLYLACLDKPTGEVLILAGEEMQILIDRTGKWRFDI